MPSDQALAFEGLKLALSLAAILGVAWWVARQGLGGDVRLRDADEVRELARAALCDFEAEAIAIDRAGIGALARDARGRVLLLRRHGSQFAARLLDSHAFARLDRTFLTVGTDDRRFGDVTLDLGTEAQLWASSLRRLGS
ncbi:hypothetical protein B0I00_2850 [Novosphingobium kunmingense]|uniref:Uncharacterized protein n=1 Tax=Novosphingobium kunmingense TaxID=1211806 RepID=A0A2N0H5K6_9SPHN|nr:hypothetical protein [Novosphingobium kunmingense]PKB14218.1 hypothetical protein B0I00_2850 [Novosphingobium kunmingense]